MLPILARNTLIPQSLLIRGRVTMAGNERLLTAAICRRGSTKHAKILAVSAPQEPPGQSVHPLGVCVLFRSHLLCFRLLTDMCREVTLSLT